MAVIENKFMYKLLLLIVIVLNTFSCELFRECSEENLTNISSPDGKYVAALFSRNCGATTGYLFHVNLRESSEEFSVSLNGAMYEKEVFAIDDYKVNLIWKDNKTLLVECKVCPANQPVRIKKNWKDINVLYKSSQNLD